MKHILKFTFSLVVLFSIVGNAQDTISKYPQRYGLRVGVDLHRLTKSFYDSNYKGLEIVGDYRLSKKFYLAGEFGNEEKTVDDDRLNFTTKGNYLKVGFDYNAFENWLDMENMIYTGVRVGFSSFDHTLNSYKIFQAYPIAEGTYTNYYGENEITTSQKFSGLNATWIEIIGGIKAEIFNNLYLGFSVRINYLTSDKKPNGFDNLYIPGFNRTYDGKFGAGFNYSLSYFIPIYKKKK
jgi:hypothetical protein